MYDPTPGRWTTEDPIAFAGGDANLFRYVGNHPTDATDPSGLREADDRLTEKTKNLIDVSKILEKHVNQVIQQAWRDAQKARDDAGGFVKRVYEQLGADEPGSEVSTPFGKFSPVTKIGVWLDTNLEEKTNQIVKLTFAESRYGDNTQRGKLAAVAFPWLLNDKTADHGIAPTIRIKDTLMGTDKWEHFFQQGYWNFDKGLNEREARAYGLWLEGDPSSRGWFFENHPDLKKAWADLSPPNRHALVDTYYKKISADYGVKTRMGYYGSFSTGVISYADVEANLAGMQFYKKLFAAYKKGQKTYPFSFSIKDYNVRQFNEQTEKNSFVSGLKVNDEK